LPPGVLVILLGKATRLSQFMTGVDKEYEAIIRLGYSTDTGDRTGNPIPGPSTEVRTGLNQKSNQRYKVFVET
jgi:tRNA U55 pseudouridine synthase TruB